MNWAQLTPLLTALVTVLSTVCAVVWTCAGIKHDAASAKRAAEAGIAELRRLRQEMRKVADRVLVLETKVLLGGHIATVSPASLHDEVSA